MITAISSIAAFYVGFRFHAWYSSSGGAYANFFGAVRDAVQRFRASRAVDDEDDLDELED
jgi:hypothetical protein